jgi:hypothetical protein
MNDKKFPPSYDRCTGWWYAVEPGRAGVHALCADCVRHTVKPEMRQSYVLPSDPIEGCVFKLTEVPT